MSITEYRRRLKGSNDTDNGSSTSGFGDGCSSGSSLPVDTSSSQFFPSGGDLDRKGSSGDTSSLSSVGSALPEPAAGMCCLMLSTY